VTKRKLSEIKKHTFSGIFFTKVPESLVVPPGDRVFFNCKTNIGKGLLLPF
jgi:hypothetical protein